MDCLYAPWRASYSSSVAHTKNEDTEQDGCVFCKKFNHSQEDEHFILKRFKYCIVILNKYPYNAGHLLILPLQHVNSLASMSKEARIELIELMNESINIVKKVLKCDGLNAGFNLGKAAGAGIPSHLHVHILPRFVGDTNFLPTLSNTKAISFDLNDIYRQLKPEFTTLIL
jgi:ATP adenylyltransferase